MTPHRERLHATLWYSGIYILKPFLKLKSQSIPITCFQALSLIFPCQLLPVLVFPLSVKTVGELLLASKCSSDLWVEFATTGLCGGAKSRSTEKPFSGFEKAVGTSVTGIRCENTAAFLSACSGGQHLR